jgi:hypothetical protein
MVCTHEKRLLRSLSVEDVDRKHRAMSEAEIRLSSVNYGSHAWPIHKLVVFEAKRRGACRHSILFPTRLGFCLFAKTSTKHTVPCYNSHETSKKFRRGGISSQFGDEAKRVVIDTFRIVVKEHALNRTQWPRSSILMLFLISGDSWTLRRIVRLGYIAYSV